MQFTLENLIVGEIFALLLVFCRIGSAMMLMPVVGEMYVPMRVRLLFTLAVSYLLYPLLMPILPKPPDAILTTALLIAGEVVIGVFMGTLTKILLATMHTAGMVIAAQSNLATAMLFDASQGGQSASVGVFLTLSAILVILTLDLHHLMLYAFVDSYSLMAPGVTPPLGDMANYIARVITQSFDIAIRFAAPVIVATLVVNLGAGILNRLMPNMQVFFVLMPVQLLLGFFVMVSVFSAIMLWYSEYVQSLMEGFLRY